jgi:SAM-dependent methyltransferase
VISQTESINLTATTANHKNVIYKKCYSCQSKNYDYFDSEYGYNLVKCRDCGLLYVNPRPVDKYIAQAAILGMHQGEKDRVVTGGYQYGKVKSYLKMLRDIFPTVELNRDGINWLDVGCGFGEFIEAIHIHTENKLKGSGIDPNEDKINSARKNNLDVSTSKLEEINEKFDFISLLNVYSHLPDPVNFLSDIRNYLKENGELLLQTGHTSHIPKEFQPRPYDLPDHLSFANKEIIINILQRIGFEIIDVMLYRSPIYPRFYEPLKIVKLLVKILIRRGEKLNYLYPKYPNTDMYIRCKLKPLSVNETSDKLNLPPIVGQ